MEAFLFILDSVVILLMVFMGLRDDRRPQGEPHTSIFRMRADPVQTPVTQTAQPDEAPAWAEWLSAERPPR